MEIVERRNPYFEVIYDIKGYRPMTNEEIYEAQIRSDFSKKKIPIVKSVRVVKVS